MPAPRKYSDELRERAIRSVNEMIKENPGLPVKRACAQVGEQLGIPPATLRNWFRGPGRVAGSTATATDPHERLAQLRRRTGSCVGRTRSCARRRHFSRRSSTALATLIDYVQTHKDQFGVEPICTVLTEAGAKIAPSTYYAA